MIKVITVDELRAEAARREAEERRREDDSLDGALRKFNSMALSLMRSDMRINTVSFGFYNSCTISRFISAIEEAGYDVEVSDDRDLGSRASITIKRIP